MVMAKKMAKKAMMEALDNDDVLLLPFPSLPIKKPFRLTMKVPLTQSNLFHTKNKGNFTGVSSLPTLIACFDSAISSTIVPRRKKRYY